MILLPENITRVNDTFIHDDSIDATPIDHDVTHALIEGHPRSMKFMFQADFYKHFALDIVTETVFDYPYPYISEKTTRPIACKRMFIILGPARILDLLTAKGFDTFGDFINADYDRIADPIERFRAVVNLIVSFVDRPLEEIKEFYRQNQERFENNFQNLISLRDRELRELEQKLIDCS